MKNSVTHLIVVAHPDDEVLGFGAAGAKFADQGDVVQTVFMCGEVDVRSNRPTDMQLANDIDRAFGILGFQPAVFGSFPNIQMNTIPHIRMVQFIEAQIATFKPQHIFTHHPGDLNDDHRQTSHACLAASRLAQRRPNLAPPQSLHFMEIPSATDWAYRGGGPPFEPDEFVEIGQFLQLKLEALACYRDVMRPYPHPRSDAVIRGLAAVRGGQAGLRLAEAFQTAFSKRFNCN